jgi:hypothetical protein
VALAAPWLAVLAAVAGLVAKVKLAIVREEQPEASTGDTPAADVPPAGPGVADQPPAP